MRRIFQQKVFKFGTDKFRIESNRKYSEVVLEPGTRLFHEDINGSIFIIWLPVIEFIPAWNWLRIVRRRVKCRMF